MVTEDKMVGWHHRLNGHEFEQALGDGEGQGSLECCSPWGHNESGQLSDCQQQESTDKLIYKEDLLAPSKIPIH